jgi:N-methylhydantoinase B
MTNAAQLAIFHHLFASVAEEMGVTLERAAYSPNIKERLDFSCAVFLNDGRMLAQAAHIPVHLGAMPASVQAAIDRCAPFQPGDVVILNDPYQGGNHLPDITLVSPIFITESPDHSVTPTFFVASRAHHADVGGMSPGSMPLSTEIYQEGIIIPPIKLVEAGKRNAGVWQLILRNVRTPQERDGDLAAQLAAHATGEQRLQTIVARYGLDAVLEQADGLIAYAERLTGAGIGRIPDGHYSFTDTLEPDIPITVTISVSDEKMGLDFTGTAAAQDNNLNAVPAITISVAAYCVRCVVLALIDADVPMNHGAFMPLTFTIPDGSLLAPHPPHAVAAGNVETSQRIVDVIFGALAQALPEVIPAASQGTMNNFTFGGTWQGASGESHTFAYYETIGGGCGAGFSADGGSGMHAHMSNTLNTPIEALEYSFPLRVQEYSLRTGSGGEGKQCGGDGLVRAIEFLTPVTMTINSERRERQPYGLQGGLDGKAGRNSLVRDGSVENLRGKVTRRLKVGDIIRIATPGGGGWGTRRKS